jgi:hypothetical protein
MFINPFGSLGLSEGYLLLERLAGVHRDCY